MIRNALQPRISLIFGLLLLAALPLTGVASLLARPALPVPTGSTPAATGDWPMYGHDISRTNYNPDETIINSGNLAQLVSRWQAPIGTNGTASSSGPSVANGRVFVGSSVATGSNFFAFNATSGGAPAWSLNLGYQSTCFNVGIGATAAISGSVVVAGGGDSPDAAYYGLNDSSNGAQLWRNAMNLGSSAFTWESPLISPNGRAYLGMASRCDNPSVRGEIRSVNYLDGSAPLSQYFVPAGTAGGGVWNSPALSPDASVLAVVTGEDFSCSPNCSLTRSMVTLDPNTLAVLQSNQQGVVGQDQDWGTTPLFFHDATNRLLVGAHLKGSGTGTGFFAYVVSNVNGGPLWSRQLGVSVGMMDAYDPTFGNGGTLFIYGSSGTLYAVDPATGVDRWTPVTGVTGAHGNMAVANGLIFLNLGSSGLQIRSESNGALLRTLSPANAGATNSGVAVSNGFIYWVAGGYVNAWSLPAGGGTPTPTATAVPPTPTVGATPTCIPSGSTVDVTIGNFFFNQQNVTIPAGTTVRWTNTGTPHTTTSDTAVWDSGTLNTNDQFSFTFNTPGTYPYHCSIHPATMTGTITVQAAVLCATNTAAPPTATSTATRTQTSIPPTSTRTNTTVPTITSIAATATRTNTTIPATATRTNTSVAATATRTNTSVAATATRTNTAAPPTATRTGTVVITVVPTNTTGAATSTATNQAASPTAVSGTETATPEVTATACAITFSDVPADSTFYVYIRCLACRGIISGYDDGTFRPNNDITRGQIAKMVSNAAGFSDDPGPQVYEDVPTGSPFYDWINRLSNRGFMGGYECGLVPEEPCTPPDNRPYFRPNASATRGQLSKIVANAAGLSDTPTGQFYTDVPEGHVFYVWIMRLTTLGVMSGYDCGGVGEPCDSENRPYFRPFNNVTRGQASKIVANTFLPDCQTPSSR